MPFENKISLVTRVADLDTQRHTTSRTYESFCLEGRHALLAEKGFPIREMVEKGIGLFPTHQYVKFMYQQEAGARLLVDTAAYPGESGAILWDQRVRQEDGKDVCHIQTRTLTQGQGLLGDEKEEHDVEIYFHDLEAFSGECNVIESDYTPLYCERDIFGSYGPAQMWKVFEEGRWLFSYRVGLTLERFVAMDTTSFYMGGVFNFQRPMRPGSKLKIRTWIESIEKIRFYFRQDVLDEDGIVMSLRDEQLIVSVSAARPRKPPKEFMDIVSPYVEVKGGN
jgi:acyl-CoA thioesterase FadM